MEISQEKVNQWIRELQEMIDREENKPYPNWTKIMIWEQEIQELENENK